MVKVKGVDNETNVAKIWGFNHPMVKVKDFNEKTSELQKMKFQPPYGES